MRRPQWPPRVVARNGARRFGLLLFRWDRDNVETLARSLFGPESKPADWNLSEVVRKALDIAARSIERGAAARRLSD